VTPAGIFGNIRQGVQYGEDEMRKRLLSLTAAALLSGGAALTAIPASAMPIATGAASNHSVSAPVETVRCRGCGWGIAAGVLGGAIIGSAIANSHPYYYDGPYGGPYGPAPVYGPGPYGPGPGYYADDDAVRYCMSRFKSYDPRSGTYLGYDGYRHPCP
jgi:hypothetical protein